MPGSGQGALPLLIADSEDIPGLLAGELLGDFAGFLSRELRKSDFALGFACASEWWRRVLPEHDMVDDVDTVRNHLNRVGPPPWKAAHRGEASLSDLPLRQRARLARVAARALRALLRS